MAQTLPLPARTGLPEPAAAHISGRHLVAKALKSEGVDTIFTLCGGHIVDIYHGCLGASSFAMNGFDMRTSIRDKAPYIAIVGNYLGDVYFEKFAAMLGVYGEAAHDRAGIVPALRRARESGTCAIINVWLDLDAYAPGTENQTMYK